MSDPITAAAWVCIAFAGCRLVSHLLGMLLQEFLDPTIHRDWSDRW